MFVCQSSIVAYADNVVTSIEVVTLNSYSEIPFNNLAPNTVYIFPNDTVPEDVIGLSDTTLTSNEKNVTRAAEMPTEVWSIYENGKYYFSGSSSSTELYTLYRFTSKTSYSVYVTNNRSSSQTVNCYRSQYNSLFQTFEIPGNSSALTTVDANYATWFLEFPAKCNVEGYVE